MDSGPRWAGKQVVMWCVVGGGDDDTYDAFLEQSLEKRDEGRREGIYIDQDCRAHQLMEVDWERSSPLVLV